jgi:hypothetical protein
MKRTGFKNRQTQYPQTPTTRNTATPGALETVYVYPRQGKSAKGLKRGKKKLPRLSTRIKELWRLFSISVRRSVADSRGIASCVCCGAKKPWQELQAGHFFHAAKTNQVSFDVRNIHPCCVRCNMYLSGNLIPYMEFLQKKYGHGIVDELRQIKNNSRGVSREWVEEQIQKYKELTK